MQLHTYLNYGGNCEEAFRFYERHLGGKITMLMRHGDRPAPSGVPPEWKDKVLLRSAYLSLSLGSIDEAERIYALLSDGGQVFMPVEETFFANRFAMLRDRFGTSWMLLHPKPRA